MFKLTESSMHTVAEKLKTHADYTTEVRFDLLECWFHITVKRDNHTIRCVFSYEEPCFRCKVPNLVTFDYYGESREIYFEPDKDNCCDYIAETIHIFFIDSKF